MPSAAELERACLAAWPGRVRAARFGWTMQATDGFSQRANAVWPLAWDAGAALAQAVREASEWCAAHAIAPCFKLADGATHPPELASELAAQGFAPRMETRVMTLPLGAAPERGDVVVRDGPSEEFWRPLREAAPSAADYAERRDIVERIAAPRAFALADHGGAPGAIGLGVLDGELVGLYLMRTAPSARRRGLARAVMGALLGWGAARGAALAYLQVEDDNAPACALYERAGFTTAYRYRYWTR